MSRRENTQTLAAATACGNWVVVRNLLCDEDVDVADDEQCLVLHKLASTPDIAFALVEDIVDEILSCNQNINLTEEHRGTAVMVAARCENWKVVWLLMSRQGALPDKDSVISFLQILGRSEHMNKNFGLSVNILSCLWDNIKKTIPECLRRDIHDVLIHVAAKLNCWQFLRDLLTFDSGLNTLDEDGLGVVHRLAKDGLNHHIFILHKVLENGGDINLRNVDGDTATHVAVKNKNWRMVLALIRRGARVDIVNNDNYTVLHMLVRSSPSKAEETIDTIFSFVQKCCQNTDVREKGGNTALHLAVKERNYVVALKLLTVGARADVQDAKGRTVLHTMATHKREYMYSYSFLNKAIACCAGLEIKDSEGNTALHLAAKLGNWGYMSDLVAYGAAVTEPDSDGCTVYDIIFTKKTSPVCPDIPSLEILVLNVQLYLAVKLRRWKAVEDLVKKGADVNQPDCFGFTVLQRLVQLKIEKYGDNLFGFLVNRGADITVQTPAGDNLLQLAAKHKNWFVVKRLLKEKQRFSVYEPDSEGFCVVHRLAKYREKGIPALFRLFDDKGAVTSAQTQDGDSLLQLAARHGNIPMVEYLVQQNRAMEISQLDSVGLSVIHHIVICDSTETTTGKLVSLVKLLINRGADLLLHSSAGDTALHLAAKHDEWDMVGHLLKLGYDLNEPDSEGFCILHRLAQTTETIPESYSSKQTSFNTICQTLLSKGADVSIPCSTGDTALHLAAKNNNWTLVKHFLKKRCDINQPDSEGFCILHRLAEATQTIHESYNSKQTSFDTIYRILLSKGGNVSIQCSTGDTALHLAAKHNNWSLVEHLVKQGSDLSQPDSEGFYILHRFAQKERAYSSYKVSDPLLDPLFKKLLNKGACPFVRNQSGDTVLHVAVKNKEWPIVEHLVELGADINEPDSEGFSILHRLVEQGYSHMLEQFVGKGADINWNSPNTGTVLHMAVKKQDWRSAKRLVELGADVNADLDGLNILHLIVAQKIINLDDDCIELFDLIISKGVDLTARSCRGDSVFHLAARNDNWKIISHRIDGIERVEEPDSEGFTILHRLAMDGNDISLLQFLLDNGAKCDTLSPFGDSAMHLAVKHYKWYIIEELLRNKIEPESITNKQCINSKNVEKNGDKKKKQDSKRVRNQTGRAPFNIDAKDSCGNTILHLNAKSRNWNQVHVLLTCGADANLTDDEGHTVLYWLAAVNSTTNIGDQYMTKVIEVLRKRALDIWERDEFGDTLVQVAARNNTVEVVDLLLDYLDDVNIRDKDGLTILHRVVQCMSPVSLKIVKTLIQRKADLDIPDAKGDTALHLATQCSNWNVVQELIENGANTGKTDSEGMFILHRLVRSDKFPHKPACFSLATCKEIRLSLFRLLVSNGIDIHTKDKNGLTAVHLALIKKEWEFSLVLLESGADIDHNVPLKWKHFLHDLAVDATVDVETAKSVTVELVTRGFNLNERDRQGDTPLNLAARCDNWKVAYVFLEQGADASLPDSEGWFVCHWLAMGCEHWHLSGISLSSILLLLTRDGLQVNQTGPDGKSCVQLSIEMKKWELFWWLVEHRVTYCLTFNEKKTILENICLLKIDDTDQNRLQTLVLCVTETDDVSCGELAQCVQKALKMSILECNWDVAKTLVDYGADIRIKEDDKPLMHILISKYRRSNHEKWLSFLDTVLTHGADINSRNREGRTILFQNWITFSYRFGKYASDSLLQALLDRGASPLIADINGKSLLRYILKLDEDLALKSVSLLIELGVSTHQPALTETANTHNQHLNIAGDNQSSTQASLSSASPTQRAFENNFVEAFEMLVESGASSNRELFELSTRYQVELSSRDMTGAETQMLDILNHAASQPRSLKSLCRLTVSHALGCGPRRMDRVKSLPLPTALQDYVLFRDALSRLTCQDKHFIFYSFLSTYSELVDEDFGSDISFESYDDYEDFLDL